MSISVAPSSLEAAARERGATAYVLTVTGSGAPHVAHAEVEVGAEGLIARVGGGTARNARERSRLSVLYPCRHPKDYSLIVDGEATVEPDGDGFRLRIAPTRAVLHRPEAAPDPTASTCGSDCIALTISGPREGSPSPR